MLEAENIPEGFYKDAYGAIVKRECSCGKKNNEMDNCEQCHPKSYFGATGWVCPVCGRGNSPFSSSCPCKPFPAWPVTCQPSLNNPSIDNNNQTIS